MKIKIRTGEITAGDKAARLAEWTARMGPIKTALDGVNGRANSFTIRYASDIVELATDVENRLEADGVSKRDRVGVTVAHIPAGPTSTAYKYSAKSTRVTLARTSGGWWLTDIKPTDVYPGDKEWTQIIIGLEAYDQIVARASAPYTLKGIEQ